MANKKLASYIFLLLLAVLAGYFLKSATTTKPAITESRPNDVVNDQKIPECYAGRCPEYFSMDVDGDHLSESVVVVPTAMTQGAGKLMIVKNGKVIFESPEMMGIWVEQAEDGDGFYLIYREEVNSPESERKVRYRYRDGQFISEADEDDCVKNNGVWMESPLIKKHFCNIKYTDGGKSCTDSAQCLSQQCIGKPQYGKPSEEKRIIGQCAGWAVNLGCYGLLEKGKLTDFSCRD